MNSSEDVATARHDMLRILGHGVGSADSGKVD